MKKNKRYVRICAALLCAVLCLSVNVAPAMAAKVTQADIDALKGNAASLDKKQKEIQSKLNSLKNDKAAAVQKKTLLDDQIANTNAKISNTEAQISDYNALISQAETELADAQQREEAQYELFCKRVREMEERGTISYWSVLFKANSFSDLLGSLDFINEVMDYDRRVIQDLQTLQAEIAEKKAGLEANKAALEAAKAELETQKKQLSAQRDEANKLVKEIDDNAAEYQATLKELEAEERRIEQQVKQMQKKLEEQMAAEGKKYNTNPGGYIWPVDSRYITSTVGGRNSPGRRWLHQPQGHRHRPGGLHQPGVRRQGGHGHHRPAVQLLRQLCGHFSRCGQHHPVRSHEQHQGQRGNLCQAGADHRHHRLHRTLHWAPPPL